MIHKTVGENLYEKTTPFEVVFCVIRIGFEPMACCLEGSCSILTTRRESYRPETFKTKKPPMRGGFHVTPIGFEPMAYCLEGSCSIQLSYGAKYIVALLYLEKT